MGHFDFCPRRAPCTSVQLWQGIASAGYGNGQLRLYEARTGTLHAQINAHARAICALDLAPVVGKVSLLLYPYVPLFLLLGVEKNRTGLSFPLGIALQPLPLLSARSDSHLSSCLFLIATLRS